MTASLLTRVSRVSNAYSRDANALLMRYCIARLNQCKRGTVSGDIAEKAEKAWRVSGVSSGVFMSSIATVSRFHRD